MNKLLRQNLYRLKHNKVFWLGMIFMFGFALLRVFTDLNEQILYDSVTEPQKLFFTSVIFVGVVGSVFSSLFLGTEYSDGTLRNKLIVGRTRVAIYLSSFITVSIAMLLFLGAYFVPAFVLGLAIFGAPTCPWLMILVYFLSSITLTLAYSALLTALGACIQNRAISAVVAILTIILLFGGATICQAKLEAPEFYDGFIYVDNLGNTMQETSPNPQYISGTEREVYQALLDVNPAGQSFQVSGYKSVYPFRLPLYALAVIIIATYLGLVIFRREDLK